MSKLFLNFILSIASCVAPGLALTHQVFGADNRSASDVSAKSASMILAGGCFWCVETDLEKLPGVLNVISGYSGGRTVKPTYKNYASGGHREVVFVLYDPGQITFAGVVEYYLKHIDPTDRLGQFRDRGLQYSPAIYYENETEKSEAERVIAALDSTNVFKGKTIGVALEPRVEFWPAEDYHQDYHTKNPSDYFQYRALSGRDLFVSRVWGNRAAMLELPGARPESQEPAEVAEVKAEVVQNVAKVGKPWESYVKPSPLDLRSKLSSIQFNVTQLDGTERAFSNPYWNNKREGIYVDVVSGAPLFSSSDKYKSGTGWPSFVKPITPDAVVLKNDNKLSYTRLEVRSRYGDSHLGHVFADGPRDRGGKRYCMNSAAMRFIPKEKMVVEGYGEYLPLVTSSPKD